ncbi:MAG: hypothetical protein JNK15_08315 [Planctomycetes bacterium]|nr:hypothetical protein [Planctomycetota bacterium]
MLAATATSWLAHVLYLGMPFAVGLWLWAGVRCLRAHGDRTRWRGLLVPWLAAAAASALVVGAVPPTMRMQFDETSLVGTSQNMHRERIAMMATAAWPAPDGPAVTDWNLDKRPPLFPFLVSVVHDVTGFRIGNAFAVNAVLFCLLAGTLATAVSLALGSALAGAGTPFLLAGVPLAATAATSAGFELLATWLLAVVVLAAVAFANAPTPARANWLLASGLLFAQSRYESIVVLAALAGTVAVVVRRWPRDRFGTILIALAPVLLAPIALLLVHARDPAFYPEANGQALVGLGHFCTHLPPFVAALFDPTTGGAMAGPLGWVALPGLLWWLLARRARVATALVAVPLLAVTGVVLAWFYGGVHESTALRLYLPIAVAAALGPLLVAGLVRHRAVPAVVLGSAVAWSVLRVDAVRTGAVLPPYNVVQALRAVDAALANVRPDPKRALVVTTVAQYLLVHDLPAMSPEVFARRERERDLAAFEVLVLETPLDALLPQKGDPRAILRTRPATLLGRIDGDLPVAVWRLTSGR